MTSPNKPAAAVKSSKPAIKQTQQGWRGLFISLWPVVVLFLGVRVLFAEAYRIPSSSMESTLLVGDWLFVNNLRFGPHVPFTDVSLPGYAEPQRNDVAVFKSPPQDPEIRMSPSQITPTLVKRIVGVGGDTIYMRDGLLFVNGVPKPRKDSTTIATPEMANAPQRIFRWQHTIEVKASRFGEPVAEPTLHNWGPLLVAPSMFFMMGDNRDNSVDSRYYGLVPRANMRGRPTFVYYSFDTEAGVDYFRAFTEIRWRRIGTWIR